ncbi:MAG: 16S rRNA (uracil(1498)-N(3))-methyltransferase [Spirochaetales bacterium]|nr:16S rRNA (uracil(1498)-N(3))-methyltransferase [Spirochaetales bacterium]
MKQLILPDDYRGEEIFNLSDSDSHYLINVKRKDIGFQFELIDNKDNKYIGKILNIEDNICTLSLEKRDSILDENYRIILFQAIPKGKKIDLMIRQAVEAGVYSFYPIKADHSIPQFNDNNDKDKKGDRWQKIVKEASQQSGTSHITTLKKIQSLKEAVSSLEEEFTGIFFHQVPLKNKSLHSILNNCKKNIVLVIGPEGGLSKKEVEYLTVNGFQPALLGKNILRAETATIFSIGATKMIIEEKDFWEIK